MREWRKERVRNWVEGQIAKACDTCEKNDGKRDICTNGFIKSFVECEGKSYRKRF